MFQTRNKLPALVARLLPLVVTLAIASGCAYESPRPVFPIDQPIADSLIAGRWTCTSPNEPEMRVTISESRPREYAIEISASGRNTARLRGFIGRDGQTTILNLQQIGASDMISRDRYAAVRYAHRDGGSLDVDVLKSRENGADVYTPLLHCVR